MLVEESEYFKKIEKNVPNVQSDSLSELKKGDKIITRGGLYGKIVNFQGKNENQVTIDAGSGIKLNIARSEIPAVTHVDGTSRLQSVSKEVNPLYYDLINEFYNITGVPVIINTSMNVMGEPIVNTPEQAHAMILKTDMDSLVMGNYLIGKK